MKFSLEQFALNNNIKLNKNQVSFINHKLVGLTTFVHLSDEELSDALKIYEQYSNYIFNKGGDSLKQLP